MITINSLSQWEELKKLQSNLFSKRIVKRIDEIVYSEIFENDAGAISIYSRSVDDSKAIHQACFTAKYEDLILYSRNDNTFVSAFSTQNDAQIQELLNYIRQNHWSNDFDYEFFFIPENDIAEIVFIL